MKRRLRGWCGSLAHNLCTLKTKVTIDATVERDRRYCSGLYADA
jgi:hypothetical protein